MQTLLKSAVAAAAFSVASLASYAPAQAASLTIDLTDVDSVDEFGDPDNTYGFFDVGAGAHITGIGWNLVMYADAPSWLSEMAIYFDNSDLAAGVTLRPGAGINEPGTQTFTGYGNLVDLGIDFTLLGDGLLYVELFETFDDFPDDWDGYYVSGTVTVDYEEVTPVPEPATWAMMIAGFGLVGGAMRRRLSATNVKVGYAA